MELLVIIVGCIIFFSFVIIANLLLYCLLILSLKENKIETWNLHPLKIIEEIAKIEAEAEKIRERNDNKWMK